MDNNSLESLLSNSQDIIDKNRSLKIDNSKDNSMSGIQQYFPVVVNTLIEFWNSKKYIVSDTELIERMVSNITKELKRKVKKGEKTHKEKKKGLNKKNIATTQNKLSEKQDKLLKKILREAIKELSTPRRNLYFLLLANEENKYIINQPKIVEFLERNKIDKKAKDEEFAIIRKQLIADEKKWCTQLDEYNKKIYVDILKNDVFVTKILSILLIVSTILMSIFSESESKYSILLAFIIFIAFIVNFLIKSMFKLKQLSFN